MVNENFDKFIKAQNSHKSTYLGGKNRDRGLNDPDYNDQDITDKSPGATGRKL